MIRRATREDLAAIQALQQQAPEAAHWNPVEYLEHDLWVAVGREGLQAFLVVRTVAPDEHEILNLAVATPQRRQGLARGLVEHALAGRHGTVFLEVRASNLAALEFYRALGFTACGRRRNYYDQPQEDALLMSRTTAQTP